MIFKIARDAPQEIRSCKPDLFPAVAPLMCVYKDDVANDSKDAMSKICECIDNPDVKPLMPHLMTALGDPFKVGDAIYKLAATVFVAQVECDVLINHVRWRMELALARAILQNAGHLLLDEPTNHLDVVNVKWVEDYLNGLKDVTSIVVSHDKGLLNNVCSHIIQIEHLKLK